MSKVLVIDDICEPDHLGCAISSRHREWEALRENKRTEWNEIQSYIFATDTTKTSNSKLPWSNKTTTPKLCQIRDNLSANYMATLFPKRKWMKWVADGRADNDADKIKAIESYMEWVIDRNSFYDEAAKLVLDYIDYGNCFGVVDWVDNSKVIEDQGRKQVGYVGPMLRRISPSDIVFNPAAPSFESAPKIVRSLVSIGEVKEIIERETTDPQEREDAMELYKYMKKLRQDVTDHPGRTRTKDEIYQVAGFHNFKSYLESDTVEILTFYGDIYCQESDELLRNHVIKVVDRHKVLSKKPNSSIFGTAPIYHAGWRVRPDNLWAMGPLDNLVGMQYRIDHLENMKADVFDLIAYPMWKVKGYVEDFELGPMERIMVGDDGDVEMLAPPFQVLQADNQIAILEQKMEEMAGSPKEAMGFRTPGEKTMYEVQRLENAAARIFQNKVAHFERSVLENCLNAMLELSRRLMIKDEVRILDGETGTFTFQDIEAADIAGVGRIRPIAARNFAEKATQVQNLSNFYGSAAGADKDVLSHFSSVATAKMWESLLDLEPYGIVKPYIRITEQADAQRINQSNQEQVTMEAHTATGQGNDYDLDGM